ncbi:hypothetical protein NDU88_001940 [Pleurodeles waltl]|uniref:Transposase n=1 Tax=Pleurodeles waltl TaxID=8319 RepID=A0AAV7P5B5_PLEWA|nr:hypothetical protein NDU88_001940 [Pleurodeles waltl]
MVRARRNCSRNSDFRKVIEDMRQRFIARGYSEDVVHKSQRKVSKISRSQTLMPKGPTETRNKKRDNQRVRIILDYTDSSQKLLGIMRKHWTVLTQDRTLRKYIGNKLEWHPTYSRSTTIGILENKQDTPDDY